LDAFLFDLVVFFSPLLLLPTAEKSLLDVLFSLMSFVGLFLLI